MTAIVTLIIGKDDGTWTYTYRDLNEEDLRSTFTIEGIRKIAEERYKKYNYGYKFVIASEIKVVE